nr:hypothetical protein [Tanacetum cinerariifolium]
RTQRVKEKQWDVLSSIHEGYHSPLHVKGSFDFERNKVNWHYVRDDHIFSTIKLTHISQASGFGADEGTGSIPGVPDVPTDESKEELSWNSTDEEGDDDEGKNGDGDEEDEGDDGEEGDGDDDD